MTALITQKIRRMTRVSGRKKNAENERRAVAAKEKAMQGLELRKASVTYEAISKTLGYSSASNAKRAIDRLLLRQEKDSSQDVIMLNLQALDEYQMRATNALRQNGDLSQIERLLRIQDQRYKLLGVGDETMRELREAYGVTTAIDKSTSVMIVQTSQTSEEDFIRKMMQAVQINPDTNQDAANYIQARKVLEIEPPKNKRAVKIKKKGGKKIIIKKRTGTPLPIQDPIQDPIQSTYIALSEADIIDAEIV